MGKKAWSILIIISLLIIGTDIGGARQVNAADNVPDTNTVVVSSYNMSKNGIVAHEKLFQKKGDSAYKTLITVYKDITSYYVGDVLNIDDVHVMCEWYLVDDVGEYYLRTEELDAEVDTGIVPDMILNTAAIYQIVVYYINPLDGLEYYDWIPITVSDSVTIAWVNVYKDKTLYYVGDVLDISDIHVTRTCYNDGATYWWEEELEDYLYWMDLSDVDMNTAGQYNIHVWYYEDENTYYSDTPPYLYDIVISVYEAPGTSTPTSTIAPTDTPTATPTPTVEPTNEPKQGDNTLEELDEIVCYAVNTIAYSNGIQKDAVEIGWWEVPAAWKYQIYRATGANSGYKLLATCDESETSYVDKTVKKGKSYYYKMRAFGGTPTNSYTGAFSDAEMVKVPSSIVTPVIQCKKSGSKLKITFKEAEGTTYQIQYRFSGGSWKSGPKGKLKKTVTNKFSTKRTLQIRIRTGMKVGGKMKYSKWSSTKTIKI